MFVNSAKPNAFKMTDTKSLLGVFTSTFGTAITLTDVDLYVKIIAGLVAIAAGLVSIVYYIKKMKNNG